MTEKDYIETNELIARRVPPGDQWMLVSDTDTVYPSITDALEAWFQESGEAAEFRLAPLDSKLYVIRTEEKVVERPKPKKFNLYGEA